MNRLAKESSPYLLQHQNNPVNWYPWGEEAFAEARTRDVPIFLSIGYATCHWCHVMEHESFQDAEVAELMNGSLISIKVDREERPEIDQIYMTVCQLMGGHCGWPLNVIMTPDRRPFFVATYVPRTSRFGRIGMLDLVPRIDEAWRTNRDKVLGTADQVTSAVRSASDVETVDASLDHDWLQIARSQFANRFDGTRGGFGTAPKFPSPHNLMFLLRHWRRTGDTEALDMVSTTLTAMRLGGVFDQAGFGFHRYSTDVDWKLPHFEKMLYDQAMHMVAYTEGYLATGDPLFRLTATQIAEYVRRDLTDPDGGFYSAEDADSEGVEGKFYTWSMDEVCDILPADDAAAAVQLFQMEEAGNFVDEATRELTGENVLWVKAARKGELIKSADLERIRNKLFAARQRRVRPLLDDKILTDWNGLMIAGLAKAGAALGDSEMIESATQATRFLLNTLRTPDGGLLHRYRNGAAGIDGLLDDYAYLTWGLIELHQATFNTAYLERAVVFTDEMIDRFLDASSGGFFLSPAGRKDLLVRSKDFNDGALPSGNSVALLNLLRLSRLTGNTRYEEIASDLVAAAAHRVRQYPSGFAGMLLGVEFVEAPPVEVVVAGESGADDTRSFTRALSASFLPATVVLLRDSDDRTLDAIAPFTASYPAAAGGARAFVCRDHACLAPVSTPLEMMDQITSIS